MWSAAMSHVRGSRFDEKLAGYVAYIEHIHFSDSTGVTSEAGLGPSCLPQSFLCCSGFGEWPSWQHFSDGFRIWGSDPACLLSPLYHSRVVSNLELYIWIQIRFLRSLCWSSILSIAVLHVSACHFLCTSCFYHTYWILNHSVAALLSLYMDE